MSTSAIRATTPAMAGREEVVMTQRLGPGPARKALSYAFMVLITLFFFAPILFMFIGSLKPSDKVLNGLGGFTPESLSFHNYTGVFDRFSSDATGHFWQFYFTSAIVAFFVVIGGLIVNSMFAYALARLQWRGRNWALVGVILLVILPFEAIAIPLFYLLNDFRNTYVVQFLPFIASAFSIYLFYTFFVGLPKQIEEAARVDGASPGRPTGSSCADVQAGVRDGDDPDIPVGLGFVPLAGAAWSATLSPALPLAIRSSRASRRVDWGQTSPSG